MFETLKKLMESKEEAVNKKWEGTLWKVWRQKIQIWCFVDLNKVRMEIFCIRNKMNKFKKVSFYLLICHYKVAPRNLSRI